MLRLIIYTTPNDATVKLHHDSGWISIGSSTHDDNGRECHEIPIPEGTPNGHGALITVTASNKIPVEQRGILWLDNNKAVFNTDDFILQDITFPFRKGLVHNVGRSIRDDDGIFFPLGATLFWAIRGMRNEPARLEQNLEYLAKFNYDYVRILGDVDWSNNLGIDSTWPDYQDLVADFIDLAYNKYGLRTQITIYGGRNPNPPQAVDKLLEVVEDDREHKIMLWEVCNEFYSKDMPLTVLKSIGRALSNKTNCLVSLSASSDPGDVESSEQWLDNGNNGQVIIIHFERTEGDNDWRFVRQPWDQKDANFPSNNNEGKGPLSSVSSTFDPCRLAAFRATSILTGGAFFVLHNGAGVFGVPNGGRPANLWETHNIDNITIAVKQVASVLPNGIENWENANDGWVPPNPVNPIGGISGFIKNYAAINGNKFVAIPHGIENKFVFQAKRALKYTAYDVENLAVLDQNELNPFQVASIPATKSGRNSAFVIVGE